jgi:hypothetical protein
VFLLDILSHRMSDIGIFQQLASFSLGPARVEIPKGFSYPEQDCRKVAQPFTCVPRHLKEYLLELRTYNFRGIDSFSLYAHPACTTRFTL